MHLITQPVHVLLCSNSAVKGNNRTNRILYFFETILLYVRHSVSVSVDFCSLFLFADVFIWFMYANITLETIVFSTLNNVSDFVTDAPAKCASTIWRFSKSDKSLVFQLFHTDCHSTQSLMHWHEHCRV
jgi:hypothetical protein